MQPDRSSPKQGSRLSQAARPVPPGTSRKARPVAEFASALLPPECGGPDPVALAERVLLHLALAPPVARRAAMAGFAGISLGCRAMTGSALDRLPHERRAAVLERLARSAGGSLALDGMKSLVVMAYGADEFAGEMRARSAENPPARPDPDLDVTPARWWPSKARAGAVVIGSGAGGAMVSRTLARAGIDVVIIEEGRRWSVDEFRNRHPHERYAELYRDAGTTIALGSPPVLLPIGRGVGGTTLVNSGTCYRPPLQVQKRWRDEHGIEFCDPDRFATYLDEVEATLQVAPAPLDVIGRNGRLLLRGAEELGWSSHPIPRNAPGCVGSCQCAIGCPRNAKFGVHLNALPDACSHGARIVTDARVVRVLAEDGRAVGVLARRHDGSTFRVLAPVVVVSAGATETPGLLRRSGLASHHAVGKNLTLHPALPAAGRFEQPVVPWRGVLQSTAIDEFHESDGVLVEATSTPPGMGSMVLPGYGAKLLREIGQAEHIGAFGAMIADQASGRVDNLGHNTIIRYDLAREDAAKLRVALVVMGKALFAAGATEVLTGIPGVEPARSVAEIEHIAATVHTDRLHLAAFHPAGTVRMGADPTRAAVDATGRLNGVRGVWVADASVLPTCPEVNPQVSIMAAALAIADNITR